jgi:protein-disulfide isomerase
VKRLLVGLMALGLVASAQAAQFSKAETNEIQTIVQKYLLAHPELLVQMSQKLQQQQYQQMQDKALTAIKANSEQIYKPNDTQVAGNPNGKVTLVEFFDYQCVHCYNLHKQGVLDQLIQKNSDLRIVYKEFPIFGDASMYASKAAMAAAAQGKYLAMRNGIFAMGEIEGKLKKADIDKVAKKIGLNMKQYKAFINGPEGKKVIDADYKVAQVLGIQGTPSFIIGPTPKIGDSSGKTSFIPGLVGPQQLQQAIDAAK